MQGNWLTLCQTWPFGFSKMIRHRNFADKFILIELSMLTLLHWLTDLVMIRVMPKIDLQ